MPSSRLYACCASLLLIAANATALPKQEPPPPTPAQWRALQLQAADKAEQIMRQAEGRKSLLGRYESMVTAMTEGDPNHAFSVIFGQYLSWYQTYIGDYPNAAASFSIQQPALPDDRPSPLGGDERAQPAAAAILELAQGRQAVFFNEAHHLPLTRTLTVELLAGLRAQGFDTFAVETIYASDGELASRGYPIQGSGFYTNEPICAEMVRSALKLGYRVVAYEAEEAGSGDVRERAQARNIYERVFKRDPKARLVVDAGYAHIQESGSYLGGATMAMHLRKLSGIDPLTVEQTMLIPHPDPAQDHPYYTAAVQRLQPTAPWVFIGKDGAPWALRPGYDVSVFFPPPVLRRGRPTWLALGGLRKPYLVDGATACKEQYPCLIEARYADEADDAIPADRMVFDPPPRHARSRSGLRPANGASSGELYLRAGQYRLQATDAEGHVLTRRNINIR